MRRPEGETELPRFENSPAYKFARAIHEKDPSPLVMQQGIYPRTSGQQAGGGQYSHFDHRNLPWSE